MRVKRDVGEFLEVKGDIRRTLGSEKSTRSEEGEKEAKLLIAKMHH